ncbi:MAG: CYTH and CHAD domain-containing protein [Pseudomonadota bacterium]
MTTPPPQEIELKLALPPNEADAFLKRMARRRTAPVEQALVTLYFDTPDFALSAAGVALRVRRVGRRWLQTLKTEGERTGGLSRRIEYEMPVRSGALDWARFPPEALACVPDRVRGQVVPVFETRFRRTAWLLKGQGGAQIEVALDVGEVVTLKGTRAGERCQPLCEIELELKSGRPDALFALALDWAGVFGCLPFDVSKAERGVRLARGIEAAPDKALALALQRGMTVEAGFAAIVQACLAQFQANLPGVLEPLPQAGQRANAGPQSMASFPSPQPSPQMGEGANAEPKAINDIEYVHQARVALRRLRAALRQFRRVCALPDELAAGLRALAAALGPARDWDVLLTETLPAMAPHAPDAGAWQRGVAVLEARRAEVRAEMRAALHAAPPGAWLRRMQRWVQAHGWRVEADAGDQGARRLAQLDSLDDWARQTLKRGHRRIVRDARAFSRLAPAERHALRIAIKRQRYAAEFFRTLFGGKRAARYLAVLRAAQDSLGRGNDAHVGAELLRTAPPDTGSMGDFARGWLAARLADTEGGDSAAVMRRLLDAPTYW